MHAGSITARAPGKLILSGEHAVIYGSPALAMAIDRFTTVKLASTGSNICFEFLTLQNSHSTTLDELRAYQREIERRYVLFKDGKLDLAKVLQSPQELLEYAFIYLVDRLQLVVTGGMRVIVDSSLPINCGLGSSAAAIISLIYAMNSYFGMNLAPGDYLELGRHIEQLRHGISSGIDLYVSMHGGYCFFIAQEVQHFSPIPFPFLAINTGGPRLTARDYIQRIGLILDSGAMRGQFAQVAQEMNRALRTNDISLLREAIGRNHGLLCELGVVPARIKKFIGEIVRMGGVAKISGMGASQGEHAGMIIALGERTKIEPIVAAYGYEILTLGSQLAGVTLV